MRYLEQEFIGRIRMLENFLPDELYKNIFSVNFKKILQNKDAIFFDYDNTLMPWGSNYLSENVLHLLNQLSENYEIFIISNGKGERFNDLKNNISKKIEILNDMKKPSVKRFNKFLSKHDINPEKSIFIGDNLITDIYTANKLGMHTIKVKPIVFKEFWATKIYRITEIFLYIIFRKKFKEIYEKSSSNR